MQHSMKLKLTATRLDNDINDIIEVTVGSGTSRDLCSPSVNCDQTHRCTSLGKRSVSRKGPAIRAVYCGTRSLRRIPSPRIYPANPQQAASIGPHRIQPPYRLCFASSPHLPHACTTQLQSQTPSVQSTQRLMNSVYRILCCPTVRISTSYTTLPTDHAVQGSLWLTCMCGRAPPPR
jgi:hypothetical protein